jgi:hypothetical protein
MTQTDRMDGDLVSARVRVFVREHLVGWTLGQIGDLFTAEGFEADLAHDPAVGGQRRAYVEQFYAAIDWRAWHDVRRYLRVVEQVLDQMTSAEITDPSYAETIAANRDQLTKLLRRDGYLLDERGVLRPEREILANESITALSNESAIPGHLARMWENVEQRPEQAISAAKDAMESAARHVLEVTQTASTGKEKFPALCDMAQRALHLHPAAVAPTQKGADSIRTILGGLSKVAVGVNEIRNLYGDGHGRAATVAGLTPRHARLVARSADAYVGMLLDTLDAPSAPWRRDADLGPSE